MVSAKKDKNNVKGTGAEKRRASKAEGGKPAKLGKQPGKRQSSSGKKKKAKKDDVETPKRNFGPIANIIRRACAVFFALVVFSRGNLGEAFGHGTGINKGARSSTVVLLAAD
jgi:hypothetical protein